MDMKPILKKIIEDHIKLSLSEDSKKEKAEIHKRILGKTYEGENGSIKSKES